MIRQLIESKLTSRSVWIELPFDSITKKMGLPTGYSTYHALVEIDLLENRFRLTFLGNHAYVIWYYEAVLFPLLQKKEGE